jgi:hypothetical protein
MNKMQAVELMVEKINTRNRIISVESGNSLIELEKQILAAQPYYRQICSEILDALQSKDLLKNIE